MSSRTHPRHLVALMRRNVRRLPGKIREAVRQGAKWPLTVAMK